MQYNCSVFVNRTEELAWLERWWAAPGARLGVLWGRRRVGKTALLQRFAEGRRAVFHVARGAPAADELRTLLRRCEGVVELPRRTAARGFDDWADALEVLAEAARDQPLLLVLDEFPELLAGAPRLEAELRAVWQELAPITQLRVLLCGSAVRTMTALVQERAPLFGRADLLLQLQPFRPWEAAAMLPSLAPSERAVVWGLCGGTPLYLALWDQARDVRANLLDLFGRPGAPLLTEGDLVLATEGGSGDVARRMLHGIATGRNRFSEIVEAAGGGRRAPEVLADLERLRLVERVVPVTDDPRQRSGRSTYRIADGFLAFWLGEVARVRGEIERGLGASVIDVLVARLDDRMGPRWEEAFREHLRRVAAAGQLGPEVVAVGPWWTREREPAEIDAVVLAGSSRVAVLVGEAKWAHAVDARPLVADLRRDAARLPAVAPGLRVAVAAREEVRHGDGVVAVTAADVFAP